MTISLSLELKSEKELALFARKLSAMPMYGLSIGLSGSLGAGKTTFVRYLVQALGSTDPVSSPTFTLEHEYRMPGACLVEHWDLYRLKAVPEDLLEVQDDKVCRLIEWADKFPDFLQSLDLHIAIQYGNMHSQQESRKVEISCCEGIDLSRYL